MTCFTFADRQALMRVLASSSSPVGEVMDGMTFRNAPSHPVAAFSMAEREEKSPWKRIAPADCKALAASEEGSRVRAWTPWPDERRA